MRVRIAAATVSCLLLAACSSPLVSPNPLGIVVVTAGGVALDDGATDVPTTLDLKVSAGRQLGVDDVTATIDDVALTMRTQGNTATASTKAMGLSSHHRLKLNIGGEERDIGFEVIGLTNVAGAEHLDPGGEVIADIAFQHPPQQSGVAADISGGSVEWIDTSHLRVIWSSSAVPEQLSLPANLSVLGGSRLVSKFYLPLQPIPPLGTLRRMVTGFTAVAAQPVLGFTVSTVASHASAQANVSRITQLAPTGWSLGATGLSGAPDATAVTLGAGGAQVWPLIQNNVAKTEGLSNALANADMRSQLANGVTSAVVAGGYPGINLDVESLGSDSRDDYTQFVKQLASQLHERGKKIAVDVVGHRPGHLNEFSAMFDAPNLRSVVDYIVLMAYDQHTANDSPGPVAGLNWDQELVRGTFGDGPLSNVWLGLPLYARVWSQSETFSTSYSDALSKALEQEGAQVNYDFDGQTPYIKVNSSITFFDDFDSLARKAAIAASKHMAGVAVWRLGFEDPAFWALARAR